MERWKCCLLFAYFAVISDAAVPQNFTAEPFTYDRVLLSWVLPDDRAIGLTIEICRLEPRNEPYCRISNIPITSEKMEHIVEDILDYAYTFRIRARLTSGAYGEWTESVEARGKPPSSPRLQSSYKQYLEASMGEEFTFKCPYLGADPQASVMWKFNGSILPRYHRDKYKMVNKKLLIMNVTESDAGMYVCSAANGFGNPVTANFTLSVAADYVEESFFISSSHDRHHDDDTVSFVEPDGTYAPMFIRYNRYLSSKLAVVVANRFVKLRCPVVGNPKPKVQWTRDGGNKMDSNRMTANNDNTLTIKKAKPNDEGDYICTASNPIDTISHTYTVKVVEVKSGLFIRQLSPNNQTVTVGSNVSFQCELFSGVTPSLFWMKWMNASTPIYLQEEVNHIRFVEKYTEKYASDNQTMELNLLNVTFEDSGKYTCVVGSFLGFRSQNMWLSVVPACNPTCLNGGSCEGGDCKCPEGMTGVFCENRACKLPCLNGGSCVGGVCKCPQEMTGVFCENSGVSLEETNQSPIIIPAVLLLGVSFATMIIIALRRR